MSDSVGREAQQTASPGAQAGPATRQGGGAERIAAQLLRRLRKHDVTGLAAEVAYRFVLALFPFGLFVSAVGAVASNLLGVANPADWFVEALGDQLPGEIADVIRPELQRLAGTTRLDVLSVGALAALWSATSATNALVKGMNRAYELPETRPFLLRYLVAVGLTLLATVGVLASLIAVIGGTIVTRQLAGLLGLGDTANVVLEILRWPVVFVGLTVAVAVLYRYGPNVVVPVRWIALGAAAFTAAWLVATALLALVISEIADYGATYGSLAGFIVLLVWFYFTAALLAGGAELVATLTFERTPEAVRRRQEEVEAAHAIRDAEREAKRVAKRAAARTIEGIADAAGKSDDERGASTA